MVRRAIPLILMNIILVLLNATHAQSNEVHCLDSFDKYRQFAYWARKSLSVGDYEYGSGDAKFLSLAEEGEYTWSDVPNTELLAHFDGAFHEFLRGDLAFHDTDEGYVDRWNEAYGQYGTSDDFYEIFQAEEEARRNALYGQHPGAVICRIRIERRVFPVLFELECDITANAQLVYRRGPIEEKKLGYSSPEHILDELRNSLNEQLYELGQTLSKIRSCE